MSGGTYTLLIGLSRPAAVSFGAAGERDLAAGWYAYTGSALGSGGFARLERHRAVATGENETRHWHVDSLLGHPSSTAGRAVTSPGAEVECAVATRLAGAPDVTRVDGIGATDCGCPSHLEFSPDRHRLVGTVEAAHAAARGDGGPCATDHPG